jgi:O-antigen/teichoic acid export membrane protein
MAWFTRDVTRTLLAQVPVTLFGLGASVLTARVLGPHDRGVYALCFLIANVAVFAATLHLDQSIVFHAGRRRASPERLAGALLPLLALLAGAVLAALELGSPLFERIFASFQPDAFSVLALAAPLMLANGVLTHYFRAVDRMNLFNGCRMVAPGMRLAALTIAFAAGGGLVEALVGVLAAEALLLPLQLAIVLRIGRPVAAGARALSGSLVAFGARLQAAAAPGQIDARLASFAVAYWASAQDLAYYAIAEGLVTHLLTLPTLVGNVLLPRIARLDDRDAAEMTAATCRSALFTTLCIALVVAAASHAIVRILYGPEYLTAAWVVVALLPVAIGRSGARILSRHVLVVNRLRILAATNATTLTVHALLLLLLVPAYGILGAAVATSAGYLVGLGVIAAGFRRLSGASLGEILFVSRADIVRLVRAGRDAASLRALRGADASRR